MANSTNNCINVCYCGNEKVFPLILLSVLSIVEHTAAPINVALLTMDLTDLDARFTPIPAKRAKLLEKVLREKNPESGVTLLDGREAFFKRLYGGKNDENSYTPYAMGRLLLSEFDLSERMLYLDSDVMCCSDLAQVFQIDLEPYEFAAALDVMGKFWINREYCNSGVMYLNLERMKKTGLLERCCEYLRTHKLMFPDQSALNRLVERKLILPPKFNEQRRIKGDTVLKHFCRGVRWWPFFHVYNIKQSEIEKVHRKLKIFSFDGVYRAYEELARAEGFPLLGLK